MDYDCVIIGAGHNGLIAAAYLAKSGIRTLVVEKRHMVGGAHLGGCVWGAPGQRAAEAVNQAISGGTASS